MSGEAEAVRLNGFSKAFVNEAKEEAWGKQPIYKLMERSPADEVEAWISSNSH